MSSLKKDKSKAFRNINKVSLLKKDNEAKTNPMHRERSRTKEILAKYNTKIDEKEKDNKSRAKSEVFADKKGKVKLQEFKEKKLKRIKDVEDKKQEEIDNFPKEVIVQFTSAEGKNLGGQMTIETTATKHVINSVINKLKDDSNFMNHLMMIDDTELTNTLKSTLLNLYNSNNLKFNSESIVKIVYHPENLYTVKPLTRGGSSLEAHTDSILTCMFSPCGKFLASGGGDKILRIWDMETFTLMTSIESHESWIMNVAWSSCGEYLVSGALNGKIIICNGKKGELFDIPLRAHKDCVTSISWKPLHLSLEPIFVSSGKDGNLRCFNIAKRSTTFNIGAHDEAVMKVIWSGENIIYSCSRDKLLKSWNEEGSLLKVFKGHGHWINTMSINTEFILRTGFYDYEQTAESSGYNKNCYLEEKSNEEKRDAALLRYNKIKKNFNFSSIDRIVTGSDDFTMILWSPGENEKPISRLTGHNQLVNHVMFSPNTLFIASGSFDKSIKLWNGLTGAFICNFFGHIAAIYQISWSTDSKYLLSASKDSTVKIWNIKSEKKTKSSRHTLPGHADEVYCIDWSPDGLSAASGSKDKRVNIWRH